MIKQIYTDRSAYMSHLLVFHPDDNPMQLSKIGHWLFTYISPPDETINIVLAISSVLPHQLSHGLQPQRMLICGQTGGFEWKIQHLEFFNNMNSHTEPYSLEDVASQQFIQQFIQNSQKYDGDGHYQQQA